eukprot:gene4519-6384_t
MEAILGSDIDGIRIIGDDCFQMTFMTYDETTYEMQLFEKLNSLALKLFNAFSIKILLEAEKSLSTDCDESLIKSYHLMIHESPKRHFRQKCRFAIFHNSNCPPWEINNKQHVNGLISNKLNYGMWEHGSMSVIVRSFPIASIQIYSIMEPLLSFIETEDILSHGLTSVTFLSTMSGNLMITLIYNDLFDENQWVSSAIAMKDSFINNIILIKSCQYDQINIIGRYKGHKVIIGNDFITETLCLDDGRILRYKQIDNGFSNPNSHVNVTVLNWLCSIISEEFKHKNFTASNDDLLELYCGNGNHTVALSAYFRNIIAVEINHHLVAAASENFMINGISNVKVVACDSQQFARRILKSKKYKDNSTGNEYNFNTVLVDPPRCGLDSITRKMILSYDKILYISCSPESLIRDLKDILMTHDLMKIAVFDQFAYTPHLETGVYLQKKNFFK